VTRWVALDLMDRGVQSPDSVDQRIWIDLVDAYRNGQSRSGKPLSEDSIRKRKEALVQMLRAGKLTDQLEVVARWKPRKVTRKIEYWSMEELQRMNMTAMKMIQSNDTPERAVAHLIHFSIAPRREDTARFEWSWIDLDHGMIQFNASKNQNTCSNRIEPRFLPFLRSYRDLTVQHNGGDVYVFPSSMFGRSGTTKGHHPHISGKTIALWLRDVQERTVPGVQPLSSHSYRHSLAMLNLEMENPPYVISRILGDSFATIEKHYMELVFTKASNAAWERVHSSHGTKTGPEGTVQPSFIQREIGFGRSRAPVVASSGSGVWTQKGEWTLGDLNPRPSGCKPDDLPG